MKGKELKLMIESILPFKAFFKGVYSIDSMPKVLSKRHFYFANLDLNHGRGSHWICILRNDKNNVEIFDSLGFSETKLEWFLKYFKIKNVNSLKYNVSAVQSNFSNSCGKFVLYFIVKRLFNIDYSFNALINEIFEENVDENEIIVSAFINSFFEKNS